MTAARPIVFTCVWQCIYCGRRAEFTRRPTFGSERYVLEDTTACFTCYRRMYEAAMARWGTEDAALHDATGMVTSPGRAVLADDIDGMVDDPDRLILKHAVRLATAVRARPMHTMLELAFDLGSIPRVVIVGASLPWDFLHDFAAFVAANFPHLAHKARG